MDDLRHYSTGARIYKKKCLLAWCLGAFSLIPFKIFEKIAANEKNENFDQFEVAHWKSHFSYSRKSRTLDILKHVSRFPRPKITQKS